MFRIDDDMTICITRGDTAIFGVAAVSGEENYKFQAGDVIRFKVTEKKACENVVFYKDFPITQETERVEILLTEDDTKIGDVISKPTDYWYEVELNPLTNPQTIIGYDDDGPKVFKLFPEGADKDHSEPIKPEDIPVVDEELDMTSTRPVQNGAIARAIAAIQNLLNTTVARFNNLVTLEPGSTTGDAEIADIRVGIDNTIYPRAGDAVREQIRDLTGYVNSRVEILDANLASAEENARKAAASAEEAAISAIEAEESSNGIKEAETAAKESETKAKYYYEQAQRISESFSGALKPGGTITFAQLLALETVAAGDMYNISDEFITTDEFKEGSGTVIPLGANVYRTSDNYWDVLAGSPVTGIKGDKENTYRRGNVNITPAQIGALTDKELRETILDTMEEINANTQDDQLAGAKAVKELSEELKKSVSDGKTLVANAITEKRVETATDASFETMAENIGKIVLGSGNATTADVLAGKTFTNDDGVEYTGTCTFDADTADATATAAQILSGQTAYVDGAKVSGTMTNRGAWTGATSGSGNVTIPAGYHNGSGYVSGSGAYNAGYSAGVSSVNLSSSNVLKKYSSGSGYDGNSCTKTASVTLSAGKTYIVVCATSGFQQRNDDAGSTHSYGGLTCSGATITTIASHSLETGYFYVYLVKTNGSASATVSATTSGDETGTTWCSVGIAAIAA